jgi:hypothetical protein
MKLSTGTGLSLALTLALATIGCGDKESTGEGANPGDCTDRADNDEDGAFDCDDPGCAGSPDCADSGSSDGEDGEDGTGGTKTDGNNDGADGNPDGADGNPDGADGNPDGADGNPDGEDGNPDGEDGNPDGADGGTDGADGGTDGADGGTDGTSTAGYDGVYVGTFEITADDGTDNETATCTWTGSSTAGCAVVTEGGCAEVVSSSVQDSKFICEFTGTFSSIGATTVAFSGSVDSVGSLMGTTDNWSTPVNGNVNGNTMFGSFTFSKNGIDFNGSFEIDK